MNEITFSDSLTTEAFLSLARRVWPGDYSETPTKAALQRTTNIGVWDGATYAC